MSLSVHRRPTDEDSSSIVTTTDSDAFQPLSAAELAQQRTLRSERSNNVYPNVKITKWISVCGKCHVCHWLYNREERFKGEKDLIAIEEFMTLHRTMIEQERAAYYECRDLAKRYPNVYMSLILDGMSQSHCQIPHNGNKLSSTYKATQHVQGAKQHFFSKSFYRTFSHVSTGTNLACHVLLCEIKARLQYCLDNDVEMPSILFLQVDGGCENTSNTFHALCEQLVRDGVFNEIQVNRLPVGHTHEDIDALFGVLWRGLQNKTLMTPQEWEEAALNCFRSCDEVLNCLIYLFI